ncbi:MAG: hypothetical protein JSS44_00415 [Proteobacteria bacterium]|nr:hypothetical protein [Pseudomonadota bacterium]MBS0465544.1 hypothetical protein [Pseudomonadota bacterium]
MVATRTGLVVAALAGCALAPGLPAHATESGFNDVALGFRYGTGFSEPGVVDSSGTGADIGKRIVNFTWVGGSASGSNLLVVDALFSDHADPSASGSRGAHEVYLIYRHGFASTALFGRSFGFGPVRSVDLSAGFDLNTKDTAYAPRKRMLVAGPQLQFDVPKGYLKAALLVAREWDHNGIVGRAENFRATWAMESSWMAPFALGTLPVQFEGYLNVYGPKGRNDFGQATRTEVLLHPRLMFDVGSTWGHPRRLWVGVGYEYWHNKFGVDHQITPGAVQNAWMLEGAWHL